MKLLRRHRKKRNLLGADDQFCPSQTVQQAAVYDFLGAADIAEVEDKDIFVFLPDAVDTSNPLFDFHWIPAEVEIDQQVGCLQVQTLGGGVGAYQDVNLLAQEPLLDLFTVHINHLARAGVIILSPPARIGAGDHARVGLAQTVDNVRERIVKTGEDDSLPDAAGLPVLSPVQCL